MTVEDVPEGAGPPTKLVITLNDKTFELRQAEGTEPTRTFQDNASLLKREVNEVSGKGKRLRKLARYINLMKSYINQGLVSVELVASKEQRANPLTKVALSPTIFWREALFLQGSQPAIIKIQSQVKRLAKARKAVRSAGVSVQTSVSLEAEEKEKLQPKQRNWADSIDNELLRSNTRYNAKEFADTEELRQLLAIEKAETLQKARAKRRA